ncbi:arginine-binding periplasmic protein-like [Amphiura filiformis]|uniref:arginine-binding periplasmic protein-like n=1 Tax=Amphiura filiformis TaxID=82378 RepID=UPI003B2144E4
METDSMKFIESPSSNHKSDRNPDRDSSLMMFQYFFLVASGVLAIVSFIIALVSLNGGNQCVNVNVSGGSPSSVSSGDDKIWMFAIGHSYLNIEYVDEVSGEVRGFDVDFINAVCRYANKNCQLVFDIYERCWNSEAGDVARGGDGLFSRYYDACAAWMQTYERMRVFQFTDPWSHADKGAFYVKKNNPRDFNWQDLSNQTIGFTDGVAYNEHCIARDDRIKGNKLRIEQIKIYKSRDALISAAINEDVDAVFDTVGGHTDITVIDKVSEDITVCIIAGFSMMTLKDSTLPKWWNPAQKKLMKTKEYRMICDDLKIQHGHWPGPTPESFCLGY